MNRLIAIVIFTIMLSSYSFASEEVNVTEYKHVVETEIRGYAHDSRGNVDGFGYSIPFKIHYNDSYKTKRGYSITINEFKVIDGVPTFDITMDTEIQADKASCKTTVRCYTSSEVYTEIEKDGISSLLGKGKTQVTNELLIGSELIDFFKENKITSIEVWIDEYDYSHK